MFTTRDSLQLQGYTQAQREEMKNRFSGNKSQKKSRGVYTYTGQNGLYVKNYDKRQRSLYNDKGVKS